MSLAADTPMDIDDEPTVFVVLGPVTAQSATAKPTTIKPAVCFIVEKPFENKVKICYSGDPDRRLKQLQLGSTRVLEFYGKIEDVPRSLEADVYRSCREYKRENDWFTMTLAQTDAIIARWKPSTA